MRKITASKRGITWSIFTTLEDLDFAEDIALLSSKHSDVQEKTERLSHFASQLGRQLNANKTEEMRFNATSSNKLKVDGNEIKQVDKFIYIGPVVCNEDSTQKDIKNRFSKARTAFNKLRPIWKSNQYSRKTKIKQYNSNVKSVLRYGSECWRVTKTDMKSLSSFHHNYLKQICKIFWPNTITTQTY